MKKIVFCIVVLLSAVQLAAREVIDINRNWQFFSDISKTSDGAQIVNLPHMWNSDALGGKKDYFRGMGNYQKTINIPLQWRDKRIFMRFHGSGTVTNLLVNGRHVGEHRGGYTAFTFEITGFLKYGEDNLIWVMVNNSPQLDVLPTAGDINIYGGLYRDVELIVTEASHISVRDFSSDGVYITQKNVTGEKAEAEALVRVDGPAGRSLAVNLSVVDRRQDTVLRHSARLKVPGTGRGEVKIPVTIENPKLWNGVKDPYLYRVHVELVDDTLSCDAVSVPLGLRSFRADPGQGFSLNGEPYPLKGVIAYEDRAGVGLAATPYQIREDLDLIQDMGANAVRSSAYPHQKMFYEECDRRGLIVWCDMPFIGQTYMTDRAFVGSDRFRENGSLQLTEMIFQRYNHPAIFAWGLFNNLNTVGDNPVGYIMELDRLVGGADPSRMTAAGSNTDGDINFITDLIVWNHSVGWTEGQPSDIKVWIDNYKAGKWDQLRAGVSYGAGASVYHQGAELVRPTVDGNWHPERWQTFFHEQYYSYLKEETMFWGIFIANMFDYGAAGRSWGEGNGINDLGLVTFDRKYRKDAFYFYKANWNDIYPFVYIAERRWDERTAPEQKIKVYSNEGEVELVVNGTSLGKKQGVNGTYEWDTVLREGVNDIVARTVSSSDQTLITIDTDTLNHNIN